MNTDVPSVQMEISYSDLVRGASSIRSQRPPFEPRFLVNRVYALNALLGAIGSWESRNHLLGRSKVCLAIVLT